MEILFKEEWLSIRENNGYTYVHEERANGVLVAILPYRKNKTEYLMRMEICPAHGDEHEFCGIIGSYDDLKYTINQTAIRELKEEAGYEITEEQLIPLGWVWDSKVADTKVYLYTVNLTDIEPGEATTDGTELEKTAYCMWESRKNCTKTRDSKIHTILNKMNWM